MSSAPTGPAERGPIAWMVRNSVTPNLLMVVLLLGGFLMALRIRQEVFPEFTLDMVTIAVPYPGASPEEVEKGIILVIEEGIRGLEGVEEVTATASEGMALVRAELLAGADQQRAYQDIKQEIDRITTFPEEAEEPQVALDMRRRSVMNVLLYGPAEEPVLRELAEQLRDRLLQDPGVSQIDLFPNRQYEISIAVSHENLRAYGLTLSAIASRIEQAALELPGGSVKTRAGEILLRVTERRDYARQFARLPIITAPAGTQLLLGDIGTVTDTFEETDQLQTNNGLPCVRIEVFRVGDQTPIGVSAAVRKVLAEAEVDLPPGIEVKVSDDRSDMYRQRLELLLRNGLAGLTLVLIVLGAFLEFRLAFWVMMGIPISFLGALLVLPSWDVSINMVSMFAFLIALGIVVDDAIVAGENIYEYRQRGMGLVRAATLGARDVAIPITFAVLTNVVAFLPLAFIPGIMGKIFAQIPAVVITVFMISWVESLFILPAHLAHAKQAGRNRFGRFFHRQQQRFSRAFSNAVERCYGPLVDACLRLRYLTVAIGIAILTVTVGYVASGRMGMQLFPRTEADMAIVTAVLPLGSPIARTTAVRDKLTRAVEEIAAEHGGTQFVEDVTASIAQNTVTVSAVLSDPDVRPMGATELTRLWRARVAEIAGLESLKYEFDRGGPGSGAALTVELAHRDVEVLDRASQRLAEELDRFSNVKDIDDGFTPGKRQLDFEMLPEGRSLGLTARDVARQLRSAFYGAEALRQQRGRNEVKVMVRLPRAQRTSGFDVEGLLVRTPDGRDVPLHQVARVKEGRAYTTITHRNGRRTVLVTGDVDPASQAEQVVASLKTDVLPVVTREFPGLSYSFEGRQADMRESLSGLRFGFVLALLAIYALLAIPFASYAQPAIVMVSIPFGIVGAIIGHLLMGYSLSVMSMMGIVALAGVVVNDALVLIVYANERRVAGESAANAIRLAGLRRFRPVMLTTLTTFGGLAPMIFETSRQARFMIPMALSLGFGILFATFITLLLLPCLYLMVEDGKRLLARVTTADSAAPPGDVRLTGRVPPSRG
ncbi:MAG: efflux RND transporter permease subunit [Planctomycetes bacterium]|nr:efflux RND transporter permease subunit [Planctomycetota bacterium]